MVVLGGGLFILSEVSLQGEGLRRRPAIRTPTSKPLDPGPKIGPDPRMIAPARAPLLLVREGWGGKDLV